MDLWRCDRYVGAMTVVLGAATKIFLIFMLCLQAHGADRVRLGYSSITANRLPLWLGQEAGIFARHGIDAELLLIPSGTTGVQALVAGEVQILSATGSTGVAAALRGADVVIIGSWELLSTSLRRCRRFGLRKRSKESGWESAASDRSRTLRRGECFATSG